MPRLEIQAPTAAIGLMTMTCKKNLFLTSQRDGVPSKKGVAIAIETVIFIILAVLVLTILLFFFTTQSGPAQQQITLQRERNEICSAVATKDPKCDDITGIQGTIGAFGIFCGDC